MSETIPEPRPPRAPKGGGGLAKKAGPFPIWVWAALMVGGIAFVLYVRSKSKSGTTDASVPTLPAQVSIFQGGGGMNSPPPGNVGPPPPKNTPPPPQCPPGFHYSGGACIPNQLPGVSPPHNGGPAPGFLGPPIHVPGPTVSPPPIPEGY